MTYKLYEVGGKIRDEIMGIPSNDVDYSVVVTGIDSAAEAFKWLCEQLKRDGYVAFAVKPDVFTIRTRFPKNHQLYPNLLADFTMAVDGDAVGTLVDDLSRRDFTINAIAKDLETGEYVDPFGGIIHIVARVLICPKDVDDVLNSDPIRILRAMRFCSTRGMYMSADLVDGVRRFPVENFGSINPNRIVNELNKLFNGNPIGAIHQLDLLQLRNKDVCNYILNSVQIKVKGR